MLERVACLREQYGVSLRRILQLPPFYPLAWVRFDSIFEGYLTAMKQGIALAERAEKAGKSGSSVAPKSSREYKRRLPVGVEVAPGGGVHFRVWAPKSKKVGVK